MSIEQEQGVLEVVDVAARIADEPSNRSLTGVIEQELTCSTPLPGRPKAERAAQFGVSRLAHALQLGPHPGHHHRGIVPEEQTLGKACSSAATDGIFDLHVFPVCASIQTTLTGGMGLVEVAGMTPRSRGSLHVTSPDPEAAPFIDHAYLSDPADHDITLLRDGLELAEELLEQSALAEVLEPAPRRNRSDDEIRREVAHYFHPVGTTPMGADQATSVCDPRGGVHGVEGLVVADVSLMPQIPRANTNIPAIVLGERVAGFLR